MLRVKLREQGVSDHLDPGKVEILLRRADEDQDGHLEYDEFIRLVKDFISSQFLNSFVSLHKTHVVSGSKCSFFT